MILKFGKHSQRLKPPRTPGDLMAPCDQTTVVNCRDEYVAFAG